MTYTCDHLEVILESVTGFSVPLHLSPGSLDISGRWQCLTVIGLNAVSKDLESNEAM